jgi:branched-chain amino acid transport system ATP-binding protein
MTETTRGRTDTAPILEGESLTKHFGDIVALEDVDVTVRDGEIVGLIGPNGAGKSTLFNCLVKVFPVTDGTIHLRGDDVTSLSTAEIVQRGVSRTFQLARVFPQLTVRENMTLYQEHRDERLLATVVKRTPAETMDRIDQLLETVGLGSMAGQPAGELSTGQKRLLNIATSLVREPDVVLLDEPAAGVNPGLVDEIISVISELNDDGYTFLIIEHDMDIMKEIADYAYVLADGTNLTEGQPREVLRDEQVLEAYFGK